MSVTSRQSIDELVFDPAALFCCRNYEGPPIWADAATRQQIPQKPRYLRDCVEENSPVI